jgi:DNA-binding transcriptional regulator YbjK
MPSRQEALLDAAIVIVGKEGIRRLTHRAVDAEAGMPPGSTSNYFKTREALVTAVVDRFAARERAAWQAIAALVQPDSRRGLVAALAAYVRRAVGPDRDLTIARYSLFIEAALHPELQPPLSDTARAIQQWGSHWLHALGSADSLGECRLLLDQIEGIVLHQLAFPDPNIDLDRTIATALDALTTMP